MTLDGTVKQKGPITDIAEASSKTRRTRRKVMPMEIFPEHDRSRALGLVKKSVSSLASIHW